MAETNLAVRVGWCTLAVAGVLYACAPSDSEDAAPAEVSSPVIAASFVPTSAPAPTPRPPLADLSGGAQPGFTVTTILDTDRGIDPGDYAWNANGVTKGPLRIVIDIEAQRLYAYRGGVEIGRSSIIWGADDKPTPLGLFPILEKDEDHISNLYDAEMPYMLRLTWDGVAIHSSLVDAEYATHGCVGVPDEFAALLFEEAKLGDKVLVTKGWMTDIYAGQLGHRDEDYESDYGLNGESDESDYYPEPI